MRKLRHEEIPRPDPKTVHALSGHPVSVLLDNVRSIYNVGAMFRTSDAALIERLYLTGITGTPENRGLHKTALGAQGHGSVGIPARSFSRRAGAQTRRIYDRGS